MIFCFSAESFGRQALKLYSIGNNSAWSSTATWSLSENGVSAGLVPQSNDTIVINRSVVQNIDFNFSGNGVLEILNTGWLRGDNFSLVFSDNSVLKCSGEIKINKLSFAGNATLLLQNDGKIVVRNTLISNSTLPHTIFGKLSVTGILTVGSSSKFSGNGTIESVEFDGQGSLFAIAPASLIPDGSLITEFNWLGTLNTNWNEPRNWAGKTVPVSSSNIALVSTLYNPEITNKAYSKDLYVNSGSSLTIHPNAVLQVDGNLTVTGAGKLLLKNTIADKASLIINGEVSGKIQSEYQVLKGQKNLISSPVEKALSQTFLNMYLRTYDETSAQWGEYIVPTNNPMQVMRGYELYSLSSETRTFEGTPAHDPQSFVVSNSGDGLNLTGNPFTCFIDWENSETKGWERNSIASAIYYPDPSGSGNFSVYLPGGDDAISINNGSRYIAPMQGFFVKAANTGSLTVNKSSRVSSLNKSKLILKNNAIRFKLSDVDGPKDEVLFRVADNATPGFDDQLDAIKIPGNPGSSFLSLKSEDDVEFAISTIPVVNSSLVIPLNIECGKAGQFSLSAAGALNFEYRYPVILEDKQLNTFTDLRADSVYSFYHAPGMSADRFVIHFNSANAINEQQADHSEVTVTPGIVTISGREDGVYTALLYSADGKLINTTKGTLSQGISISTHNTASGFCILQLSNGKQTITKKIFMK